MKKSIYIILLGSIGFMAIQGCQEPQADQATIDAKVTEVYNAKKMEIENNAATACEDAINAKVKSFQDSMTSLSAAQQAAALAKAQKDLKIAQAKADSEKKKRAAAEAQAKKKSLADSKKKPEPTVEQVKQEVIKKETEAANSKFGGGNEIKQAPEEETKKANSKFGGQ